MGGLFLAQIKNQFSYCERKEAQVQTQRHVDRHLSQINHSTTKTFFFFFFGTNPKQMVKLAHHHTTQKKNQDSAER